MKICLRLLAAVSAILIGVIPAHAQGGCVNSPENPTVVLALIGSGSALIASVRKRSKTNKK